MSIVRIMQTIGLFSPHRAFCNASEMRSGSTIPSELLTICWVISTKWGQFVEIAPTATAWQTLSPSCSKFLLERVPTSARRMSERRCVGRTELFPRNRVHEFQ